MTGYQTWEECYTTQATMIVANKAQYQKISEDHWESMQEEVGMQNAANLEAKGIIKEGHASGDKEDMGLQP
jgi:hypothetical protein